jgi:hypothetical protein
MLPTWRASPAPDVRVGPCRPPTHDARDPRWRPGGLRHTAGSAESCCLPALTRFTGCSCTGPGRHLRPRARHTIACPVPGATAADQARPATGHPWRDARAAESARLESVCGATHRGFESHSLRPAGPDGPAPSRLVRSDLRKRSGTVPGRCERSGAVTPSVAPKIGRVIPNPRAVRGRRGSPPPARPPTEDGARGASRSRRWSRGAGRAGAAEWTRSSVSLTGVVARRH